MNSLVTTESIVNLTETRNDDGDDKNDGNYLKTTESKPSLWQIIVATQVFGSAIYDRYLYHKVLKKFQVPYFLYLYSGFIIFKKLLFLTFPSLYPGVNPKTTLEIETKRYMPVWFLLALFREILLANEFKNI